MQRGIMYQVLGRADRMAKWNGINGEVWHKRCSSVNFPIAKAMELRPSAELRFRLYKLCSAGSVPDR